MKQAFLSLVLCALFFYGHGQVTAIQNDRANTIYIGTNNYLTIAIEQCPADTIKVDCDGCTILKSADNDHNHFNAIADSPGYALLSVKKKAGKEYKLIENRRLKIEYLPDPIPFYARRKGGAISVAEMDEGFLPIAKLPGFEKATRYTLDTFTIMVIRGDKLAFSRRQAGGVKMDDVVLNFFKTLQEKDRLYFTDLSCIGQDKRKTKLPPMEFTIVNSVVNVNGERKE